MALLYWLGVTASRLVRHEGFNSTRLGRTRDITIYLPAGFPSTALGTPVSPLNHPSDGWPCLLLHDGQNLFDPDRAYSPGHHWRIAETADALIHEQRVPPMIIVGMDHGNEERILEYTPTPGREPGAGLAANHARFVVEEVLPFVREHYGVTSDPSRLGLGGSSLGGLVTMAVALAAPGVFGRLLAMSPSVWWDRRVILQQIEDGTFTGRPRVWIDAGSEEGARTVSDARRLARVVARHGAEVKFVEAHGAGHDEDSWAARFGEALEYLFGE